MHSSYRIRRFPDFASLPPAYRTLLQGETERLGLFRDPEWFEHLMQHFFEGDELRLFGVEEAEGGHPLLLVPMRYSTTDYAVRKGRVMGAISNPENYTTVALMCDPAIGDPVPVLEALFRHFRGGEPDLHPLRYDAVRLWPAELDSEQGRVIHRALRGAGFLVQTYANSFNRFEGTEGLSYEDYFALRSANMRYNVRRRERALQKRGDLSIQLVTEQADLDRVIPDYIFVSRNSWKMPTSMYSLETMQLMKLCADKGCLRLGILRLGEVAVAVQFWIVSGGTAHCARLAYHEDYRKQAVGVVLTGFMIAHVLDQDRVGKLDYGYGRDEYKRGWMRDAREYYGFIAFNPSSLQGLAAALQNILGRPLKRLLKRGLGAMGWKRFQERPEED